MRLQIKDLQFIESETAVSIYKVSKNDPKDVLPAELEKFLIMTQERARYLNMNEEGYNSSMDIGVDIGKTLPTMNLQVQIAKLKGQEVTTFNKLSNRAQYARKSWHLEVASKYTMKMKSLIQMVKENGCGKYYWGVHAHLSEITDLLLRVKQNDRYRWHRSTPTMRC